MRSPIDLGRDQLEGRISADASVGSHITEAQERIRKAKDLAAENMKTAKEKAKRYYDAGARIRTPKKGDQGQGLYEVIESGSG